MTTTHADPTGIALLREVLRVPDEDTPRLVYADWLQEQGEGERAEFIRASIRLSLARPGHEWGYGSPPGASGSDERTMFDFAGKGVFASVMEAVPTPAYWTIARNLKVVRGFVSEIHCTAEDWIAHAATILAAHPVARVTLTTWPNYFFRDGDAWVDTSHSSDIYTLVPGNFHRMAARRWGDGITFTLPPG